MLVEPKEVVQLVCRAVVLLVWTVWPAEAMLVATHALPGGVVDGASGRGQHWRRSVEPWSDVYAIGHAVQASPPVVGLNVALGHATHRPKSPVKPGGQGAGRQVLLQGWRGSDM